MSVIFHIKHLLFIKPRLRFEAKQSRALIYTHLVTFEGDEYHTAVAKTLKKDQELLEASFKYVTERDGTKIYRKRKQA